MVMQLPIDDKHSYHKDFLESQLAILMAGRIAEEIFMKHITTGAGNDIERATDMARKMTTGMKQANGEIAIEAVMDVQHVARAVVHMASLPLDANVQFMTVMATKMPFVGRG